jgi:ABC-type multidrug transport system fused ATPase/permease subunit
MDKLKLIFRENWGSILFSYLLFTMQSMFMLFYPKVLGDSIDHLIAKDYFYIGYLMLCFVGLMFFGYLSQIYDTKVFSKILRKFASKEIDKQIESGVETTKINGRLTLMGSIVHFFERDVITILSTIYGLIGSIYFISLVDGMIVFYLILSGIATILVTIYFSPKIAEITEQINDISEEQTEKISTRNMSMINNLLRKTQKLTIKSSNIQAKYFLWIQIIAYGTVTSLLTYYVVNNTVTVGGVFSTYRYLFDFCISISHIPMLIASFINIRDVIKRLETEN